MNHLLRLPIIVVTAELGDDITNEVLAAGANQLIAKPAHSEEIFTAITKYCTPSAKRVLPVVR
jgi:CheY-like chemotaxis protein